MSFENEPIRTKPRLRWHNAYTVLLVVRGCFGCLGLLGYLGTFTQLNNYYYNISYDAKNALTGLYTLCLFIDIARVVLDFTTSSYLKKMEANGYYCNNWLMVVSLFSSFMSGGVNGYTADGFGWGVALMSTFIWGLSFCLPNFIYYSKRKALFIDEYNSDTNHRAILASVPADIHEACKKRTEGFDALNEYIALCLSNSMVTENQAKVLRREYSPQNNIADVSPLPLQTSFCRKCGEKLLDGSEFCRKCGTKVIEVTEETADEMQ